jgi:hypothetical protein
MLFRNVFALFPKQHVYFVGWIQVRSAARFKDCIKTSLGVLNPNLFLGQLFNCVLAPISIGHSF